MNNGDLVQRVANALIKGEMYERVCAHDHIHVSDFPFVGDFFGIYLTS